MIVQFCHITNFEENVFVNAILFFYDDWLIF